VCVCVCGCAVFFAFACSLFVVCDAERSREDQWKFSKCLVSLCDSVYADARGCFAVFLFQCVLVSTDQYLGRFVNSSGKAEN